MRLVRYGIVGWLVLAVLLGGGGESLRAQDAECAPVGVGDSAGIYFLALGPNCDAAQADGYLVVAHLVRDDESSEVLVLVDADHADEATQQVAQILAEQVKDGSLDGGTWHDQPPDQVG